MNELKFWQLVYLFIQKYDYQIAYYNEVYKDVWLKNSAHKLVRLMYREQVSEIDSKNFARYSINGKDKLKENFKLDILKIKTYIIDPQSEIAPFYKKYIDDEDITIEQFIIKDMEDLSLTELSQTEIDILTNSKASSHYKNKLFQKKSVTKPTNKNKPFALLAVVLSIVLGYLATFAFARYTNNFTYEKVGALYPKHFWEGHVYQIVTSIFANNHLLEMMFQVIILLMMSFLIRYVIKPSHIIYYFIIGGILANISNLIFESTIISMGAQGAIAALLGALTYLIITKRAIYHKDSMLIIGISTAFILVSTLLHLDHNLQVHFIGYIVGILLAYLSRWRIALPSLSLALVISLVIIFSLAKVGWLTLEPEKVLNTEQKVQNGDVNISETEQSIKKGTATDQTYLEYGLYKLMNDNYEEAQKYWLKGLSINPNNAELNYQVAIIYRAQNNLQEALKYAQKAEDNHSSQQYQVLIDELKTRIDNADKE